MNRVFSFVEGYVRGLPANAFQSSAASVEVTSNGSGDFGVGSYVSGNTFANGFTISNGSIVGADFQSPKTDGACCWLYLFIDPNGNAPTRAGLSNANNEVSATNTGLLFTPVTSSPIPLPAPVLLLGAALASLAGISWRHRRGSVGRSPAVSRTNLA